MKVAIHKEKGSFSDRWIPYCERKSIPFIIVDCYATDIISKLKKVDCLLWHWHLSDRGSYLFAKTLTLAVEEMGIKVYPDSKTGCHYDDKIAQKYFFEAFEFPFVPSYVFYSEREAIEWVYQAEFPKVFKLRGGAGSVNVKLAKSRTEALKLIDVAFKRGFTIYNRKAIIKDRIRNLRRENSLKSGIKLGGSLFRIFVPSKMERLAGRQAGYVYFQDFYPNLTYDLRLVVIGNRCFGLRRFCREGDFRASGSGNFSYDNRFFSKNLVSLAFHCAKRLKMQSVAFDFIESNDRHLLVEISYCFTMGSAYDNCPGYWDKDLTWVKAPVDPQAFILEDIIGFKD